MSRRRRVVSPRVEHVVLAVLSMLNAEGTTGQSLDELRPPAAPAFAILGIQPVAIERPTTPRQLGLGLLSATAGGALLPEDFAIEVAPYWMIPKPELTFQQRFEPSAWQSVKQTFALSAATDRPEDPATHPTRLGFGLRFQPFPGRPVPESQLALDSIRQVEGALVDLDLLIEDLEDERNGGPTAARRAEVDALLGELEPRRDALATLHARLIREWAEIDASRTAGLRLEVAAAVATSLPNQGFSDASVTSWGLWTTVSLRPAATEFDVLATLRYQHVRLPASAAAPSPDDESTQEIIDFGARAVFDSGPFQGSAEVLRRFAFDINSLGNGVAEVAFEGSYRAALTAEYALSDGLAFAWTLGRDFILSGTEGGDLLSFLALRLGLGRTLELPFQP